MVGYDSIISPGREGKITQEIKISSGHNGEVKKYITLISNAKNKPEYRLSLKGTIIAQVSADPTYISLSPDSTGYCSIVLKLSTDMKDFSVTEVTFIENSSNDPKKPSWQAKLPTYLKFSLGKPDSVKADGIMVYPLNASLEYKKSTSKYGSFILKTNNPKKNEVSIPGILNAYKK